MTTATGEFAVNFNGAGNQNPWSNANFTVRNGGTTRIDTNVLRPNTTGFFAYTGSAYDGGSVSVSAEVNAVADDDEVCIGSLDQNGDGFVLRIRSLTVVVLVLDNYAVVDSFGSGAAILSADDLYAFTVTKGSPNTVAATKNGVTITLSATTYSLTLATMEAIFQLKAENVGTAAVKSLAVVDGLSAASGSPPRNLLLLGVG